MRFFAARCWVLYLLPASDMPALETAGAIPLPAERLKNIRAAARHEPRLR